MNVQDLLEFLGSEVEAGNLREDAPVKLAIQPNYPMEYETAYEPVVSEDGVLYLGEHGGAGNGYLSGDVAEALWD